MWDNKEFKQFERHLIALKSIANKPEYNIDSKKILEEYINKSKQIQDKCVHYIKEELFDKNLEDSIKILNNLL